MSCKRLENLSHNSETLFHPSVIGFPCQNFAYLLNINKARNSRPVNNAILQHLRLESILVHIFEFGFALREYLKLYTNLLDTELG